MKNNHFRVMSTVVESTTFFIGNRKFLVIIKPFGELFEVEIPTLELKAMGSTINLALISLADIIRNSVRYHVFFERSDTWQQVG